MRNHRQLALSVLTLCISQQLYAQTETNSADIAVSAETSVKYVSDSVQIQIQIQIRIQIQIQNRTNAKRYLRHD